MGNLFKPQEIEFARYGSLKTVEGRVQYLKSKRGTVKPGGEYILRRRRLHYHEGGAHRHGTDEIVASHYGRTHGDPVNALKNAWSKLKSS